MPAEQRRWSAFLSSLDDLELLAQQQDFEIFVAVLDVANSDNIEQKGEEKSQEGVSHHFIRIIRRKPESCHR